MAARSREPPPRAPPGAVTWVFFPKAARRRGARPDEAAIVGDTEYDMGCGRDAALRWVVGLVGERTEAQLRAGGATHVVHALDEVAAVVDVLQTPALLCRQTDFIMAVAMASMPGSEPTSVGMGTGIGIAGFPMGETLSLSA